VYLSTWGLIFDLFYSGPVVELVHFNFIVKVADITDDGLILHLAHVLGGDDILVSGGGDVDVGLVQGLFDPADGVSRHAGLQGTDGIDLGDEYPAFLSGQGFRGAFADIAKTADHGGLAGQHDIHGPADAVHQGMATAIDIVEF
jgi:hypothetical protein